MPVAQVRDVAALAGVSPATVSNALNHPAKVSPTTLARIQSAIDELGYIRNDAARQLRAGTNRAVGMIVLDIANPFFTDVARGVEDVLLDDQRPLILGNSSQEPHRETNYLDLFEQQRMDGVLITPVANVLDRLRRLRDRGTSVVLVDRMTRAKEFSSVSIDDKMGGRIATEHLLEIGRRRIAFIGGPANLTQVGNRLSAARAAVDAFGSGEITFVETESMNADAGRIGVEQLLSLPEQQRPDAVFAANDMMALGCLYAFAQAGVRVPTDVALAGFDDIPLARFVHPSLTTMQVSIADLGDKAATRLLQLMDGNNTEGAGDKQTLVPTLIVRDSSKARTEQ